MSNSGDNGDKYPLTLHCVTNTPFTVNYIELRVDNLVGTSVIVS